jgi:predicted MPP superfamily phosphohydrolase
MEFRLSAKRSLFRVLKTVGMITALVTLCIAYARFVEPTWLRVRHVKLSPDPTVRIIHISDIHFKGDARYLKRVVTTINRLDADLVCFTGDLVESAAFLDGALRCVSRVNKPIYGVPGNHDQWALRSFDSIRDTFRKTGGEWLDDRAVLMPSKRVALLTAACCREETPAGYKRVLLEHYPESAAQLRDAWCDLILAGHTHGGQASVPFLRNAGIPLDMDTYDRGLFQTPSGPLYVNPGIGTYYLNLRFLCRPEVTLIEI